jgi:gliding motility-associated lipoprotein GldH
MRAKALIFLVTLTLLFSCNETKIFSKFDGDFPNNRWEKTNQKAYSFSINDEAKLYDIVFRFSHVYDYQFASVPITIQITDPTGKKEKLEIDLKIKDDSGKQLAECAGDICDLKFKIKEAVKLSKGNYTIAISHTFNGPYLPNVLGIGLNVEIAK